MSSNDLPDDDHVVRYAKPTSIRTDGKVTGAAFCLRSGETGLSVNWLECYSDHSKDEQLSQVRRLYRLGISKNGRLAELNIGTTKRCVSSELEGIRFVHKPLPEDDTHEADPSHSEVTGLPQGNSPEAELIGDMIAQSITAVHPAV